MNKKRVVVAMSGGVDSSVTAALLSKEGHEVIGITLRLWTPSPWNNGDRYGSCCSPHDVAQAKDVAMQLNIPHYTFNLEEKFKEMVVDNFVSEYLNGSTPNPCVRCNSFIKFDILFKYALALEADFLATGHYAKIIKENPDENAVYRLAKANDLSKDQSYFLYMLNQSHLSNLLFPLGEYTKDQAREFAREFKLVNADKPDSQDVCFLEGRNYRQFIEERAEISIRKGPIKTVRGEVLGEHVGLPYYTIGQREKLGIATGERLYVIEKNVASNSLVVGVESENLKRECKLHTVNWCSNLIPQEPVKACVKVRYRHAGAQAAVHAQEWDSAQVLFETPVGSITSGQSAVFYDGDFVLGGGIIG